MTRCGLPDRHGPPRHTRLIVYDVRTFDLNSSMFHRIANSQEGTEQRW